MALIPAIFGLIGRWVGRILNTAFGWATMMLFGKVPKGRQLFLSVISFGSVAWLIVLLGVAFPRVGTLLLTFVKPPDWVGDTMIRLIMLAATLLIPLVVGVVSLFIVDPEDRPRGGGAKLKAVLKGYIFTPGLAVTLLLMTIFAPLMKLKPFLRRWSSQHVPVIVEPEDYLGIVGELQQALQMAGFETSRRPASPLMRIPTKILTTVSGGSIQNLVADNLTRLEARNLEVELHPSDLLISGKEQDVARARATIAEQLAFSKAYLTWNKESNELEDRLTALWREMQTAKSVDQDGVAKKLDRFEQDLKQAAIPYEEWEVIFRKKLLVERGLLHVVAGLHDRPKELTELATSEQTGAAQIRGKTRSPLPRVAALAGLALLAWLKLRPRHDE